MVVRAFLSCLRSILVVPVLLRLYGCLRLLVFSARVVSVRPYDSELVLSCARLLPPA